MFGLRKVVLLGCASVAMLCGQAYAAGVAMDEVQLRALDKVTGRTSTLQVKVGEVVKFGTLLIKPDMCKAARPEETPENAVFLEIVDVPKKTGKPEKIFSGWMFSSSPALSALESSVYDVWVIKCAGAVAADAAGGIGVGAAAGAAGVGSGFGQGSKGLPAVMMERVVEEVPEEEVRDEAYTFD